MKLAWLLLCLAVVAALAGACSDDDESGSAPDGPSASTGGEAEPTATPPGQPEDAASQDPDFRTGWRFLTGPSMPLDPPWGTRLAVHDELGLVVIHTMGDDTPVVDGGPGRFQFRA